jgi:hypothetical protein
MLQSNWFRILGTDKPETRISIDIGAVAGFVARNEITELAKSTPSDAE